MTLDKLFWLLVFSWTKLVKSTKVATKTVSVSCSTLCKIVNHSCIQFAPAPGEIDNIDVSSLIISVYGVSTKEPFDIGIQVGTQDMVQFYHPTGKTINDFLAFAFANGEKLSEDMQSNMASRRLYDMIESTLPFCSAVMTGPHKIWFTLSLNELYQIFWKNFAIRQQQLMRGQKFQLDVDHDIRLLELLTFDRQYDFIVFIPREESVESLVAKCAAKATTIGSEGTEFLQAIVAALHEKGNPATKLVNWTEMLDEMYLYSKSNDGSPGLSKNDNFQVGMNFTYYAEVSTLQHFGRKLYVVVGDLYSQLTNPNDVLLDFIEKSEFFKARCSSDGISVFQNLIRKCINKKHAKYTYNVSSFGPEKFTTLSISKNDLNERIRDLLRRTPIYLNISLLKDLDQLRKWLELQGNQCTIKDLPFITGQHNDDNDMVEEYAEYVASKVDPQLARADAIDSFFNAFFSPQTLKEYEIHLVTKQPIFQRQQQWQSNSSNPVTKTPRKQNSNPKNHHVLAFVLSFVGALIVTGAIIAGVAIFRRRRARKQQLEN